MIEKKVEEQIAKCVTRQEAFYWQSRKIGAQIDKEFRLNGEAISLMDIETSDYRTVRYWSTVPIRSSSLDENQKLEMIRSDII